VSKTKETKKNLSRSPPPTFEDAERKAEESTGSGSALGSKNDNTLLLENTGAFLPIAFSLMLLKLPFVEA
jgi:hypothetical protein